MARVIMTTADRIVALVASLDQLDTRFLAIQSLEDWIAVWRVSHAEDREYVELGVVDVGGES